MPSRLKHPWSQLGSACAFPPPFYIPGASFHPLLPIGICSPLIICHLEKLCLNSLCIWPLLSVYLWRLNMVLGIRTASHASTKPFPSQKSVSISSFPQNINKMKSTLKVFVEISMCSCLESVPLSHTHILRHFQEPAISKQRFHQWVWSNHSLIYTG